METWPPLLGTVASGRSLSLSLSHTHLGVVESADVDGGVGKNASATFKCDYVDVSIEECKGVWLGEQIVVGGGICTCFSNSFMCFQIILMLT